MIRFGVRIVFVLCLTLSVDGCKPPLSLGEAPVDAAPLPVVARILLPDSFPSSGAMIRADCSIVLVGGEWGTLIRIDPNGDVDPNSGRIPGAPLRTNLGQGPDDLIVAWSDDPPFWGLIHADLSVTSMRVPLHPWGTNAVGAVTALPNGYVMTQAGDIASPQSSPDPWQPAPLAVLLDSVGRPFGRLGVMENRGGRYLSWFAARAAIGSVGDTVVTVRLSEGIVDGWLLTSQNPVWTDTLPRYIDAPIAREELYRFPWIQYGGELRHILAVPQIALAVLDATGTIYAVRNHRATWSRSVRPYLQTQGRWAISHKSLDIYTSRGELRNRFDLPSGVRWITASPTGHILLRVHDEILISDAGARVMSCTTLPERIVVVTTDSPPEVGEPVAGGGAAVASALGG